jgi:hypothetical protein
MTTNNIHVNFNMFFNRFEILAEAKGLSKNELKELSYRERKVLNIIIKDKHFQQPYENKEIQCEIKIKRHLDSLIEHKPVHRSKTAQVFFEVKNKVLQLATGDIYRKLHPEVNLAAAKLYKEVIQNELVYSFAADITGKAEDLLNVEQKESNVFLVSDYVTKKPLLTVKIAPLATSSKEAHSVNFLRAGKINNNSKEVLIAYIESTSQIYS